MTPSLAVAQALDPAPLSPLVPLLLREAQPGYERVVLEIGQRWSVILPPVFEGATRADVATRAVEAAEGVGLTDDLRLQVAGDLVKLCWWCGMDMPDAVYVRIARLMRGVFGRIMRQVQAPPRRLAVQPRSHALFAGALVTPLHSPSRGAIDYARALADDPAVERVHLYHRGPIGEDLVGYIQDRLGGFGGRVALIQDRDGSHLSEAVARGPYVHHFWCEDPLAVEISVLSILGPTVMFTCGDEPPVQYADAYWYLHEPDYIARSWRRRGVPESFIRNYVETGDSPSNVSAGVEAVDRAALGLSADTVVLATVGNRLAVDLDQAFVDGMGALLRRHPKAHWMIVGGLPPHLLNAFRTVLGPQVSHVPFERALRRLLTVADIFVNPFRRGGADSAMLAMLGQAVTLTRGDQGDVRAFVPAEHRRAATPQAFFAELDRLVADGGRRQAWRQAQGVRAARVVDEAAFTRTLARLSALAFARYLERPVNPVALWADC